jgi:hypothetical protein
MIHTERAALITGRVNVSRHDAGVPTLVAE